MSRGVLALAGALLLFGTLIWFLALNRNTPAKPGRAPAGVESPRVVPNPDRPLQPPAVRDPEVAHSSKPPRISTAAELARALTARGLDAEKLIARYQDWRVTHGFLGADPLAGITPENAPTQVYAAMDRSTQKALADSGDLGAIQAYAAGSLPADPFAALKYYGRASELGSAAAMAEVAGILARFGSGPADTALSDPASADKLLALRGGDPGRDLGRDAAAWTLASIRQYGPIVATAANVAQVEALEAESDKAVVTAICAQSLAILANLSAATAGRDAASLPPVFVTEEKLYDRLPCQETPAPVTPPRALEACTSSPATGNNNQPLQLWICPEN